MDSGEPVPTGGESITELVFSTGFPFEKNIWVTTGKVYVRDMYWNGI